MNNQELKAYVYLSALLQHIPNPKLSQQLAKAAPADTKIVPTILAIADQYALTQAGVIKPHFKAVASVFEGLKRDISQPVHFHQVGPFTLQKDYFPTSASTPVNAIEKLWENFVEASLKMDWNPGNLEKLAKGNLALLFQYASSIPNPSNVNAAVSWYDYAKIKAGLAICIYEYLQDKGTGSIADQEEPIAIIRADLSGIQSFIYDIASQQASKNLKGRSFYIQLLSESVLQTILDALGLFEGNVMYSSGGNFFLIAPNTPDVLKKYEQIESRITEAVFHDHQARLSVVFGLQVVSQQEILHGQINQAIKRLFEDQIDRNKKRKLSSLNAAYEKLFEPSDDGGETDLDGITGEEIPSKSVCYELNDNDSIPVRCFQRQSEDGKILLRELTAKQIFLGRALKDHVKYLIMSKSDLSGVPQIKKEHIVNPCDLGFYFYLYTREDSAQLLSQLIQLPHTEIIAINEESTDSSLYPLPRLLYGGRKAPVFKEPEADPEGRKKGDLKYFHDLTGDAKFKRLAILRMDVDGLGSIFKEVSAKPLTFSYYAALSRNLDWFFKGYLNTIWEQNEDYADFTQIIYSGGDDLFIIGRWDVIIKFAEEIKAKFAEFTCTVGYPETEKITISGGISMVTNKFPIIKAAAFADEAEKAAKRHHLDLEEGQFEKNSISLLGHPLHWESEYLLVKDLKEAFVQHVERKDGKKDGIPKLPKSILSKIQEHAQMAEEYEKENIQYEYEKSRTDLTTKNLQAPTPRWIWNIAYDFSRLTDRIRGEAQSKTFLKQVQAHLDGNIQEYLKTRLDLVNNIQKAIFLNQWESRVFKSKYHFIKLLGLAARWAELDLRD